MPDNLPDAASPPTGARTPLPGISAEAYRHPLDRQATRALRAVPGFELAVSKISRYSLERFLYVEACAEAVRVTPRQCGRIHEMLRETCAILDVAPEPTLFLSQTPIANAFALGREMPSIVIQTGLVELLNEDELRAVIAHELGHIHCGHTVYRLMAWIVGAVLARYGALLPGVGDWLTIGLEVALLEWARKAEFSADRAAILCVRDPEVVFSALFKLTGGSPKIAAEMDRDEYLRQADDYDSPDAPPLDKLYKTLLTPPRTHPIPVLRAREVLRWGVSDEYRAILAGDYPRRDKAATVGDAASVTCGRCGQATDSAFSFCTHCGAVLSSDEDEG